MNVMGSRLTSLVYGLWDILLPISVRGMWFSLDLYYTSHLDLPPVIDSTHLTSLRHFYWA